MRFRFGTSILLLSCLAAACGSDSDGGKGQAQLQAGVSEVRMPVPVGIGTVGYLGITVSAEPSPFAHRYPATTRVHGHPSFRAVAISRGPGQEIVFLRTDMIGVFQQFRRAIVLAAEARLGRPIDDALVIGGTHTHSGPGRVLDGGGVFDLIADSFFPEFYERMVDAAATAIVEAFEDLKPARVGHVLASSATGHSDRRCEDGQDHTNDDLPVIAIERDEKIDALVFAYAVHSTALGIEELTLSRDVAGAIEEHVESRFDHPVLAVYFNSWAADMSPGSPDVTLEVGAAQPGGYERMSKVGHAVADAIQASVPNIAWEDDPEVFAAVHRVHLNRTAIGYAQGEFPFEFGGVFCGGLGDTDCDPQTTEDDLDKRCIPFPPDHPVPPQTEISAGRVGSLAFVTFPGEPGTLLAEELLARLHAHDSESDIMLFGYAQDYTGYSILPDDWIQGGYEASGGLWGPRQGQYLVDSAEAIFERVVVDRGTIDPLAPAPLPPFDVEGYTPYAPAIALENGTIAANVLPSYGPTEIVTLTVRGNDPWLGAPTATLVDVNSQPVLTASGQRIESNGYGFWVDLQPMPKYSEVRNATERIFLWTFSMPAVQTVPGLLPDLRGGTYRLSVSIPFEEGTIGALSSAFTIRTS